MIQNEKPAERTTSAQSSKSVVVSKTGAALRVERIEVSEAVRKSLTTRTNRETFAAKTLGDVEQVEN